VIITPSNLFLHPSELVFGQVDASNIFQAARNIRPFVNQPVDVGRADDSIIATS
jgi:hypothetical protein